MQQLKKLAQCRGLCTFTVTFMHALINIQGALHSYHKLTNLQFLFLPKHHFRYGTAYAMAQCLSAVRHICVLYQTCPQTVIISASPTILAFMYKIPMGHLKGCMECR